DKPKIEIFRSRVHESPLFQGDQNLVALVSDVALDFDVPCFDLDDTKGLADFVEKRFLSK
ncbi:MAG: molybdopterin-guanine dinucleotide biosynthesis protein B, partial [Deltaproteobacteria bacterium]|nr:molybdopterin-guanine dinucleotide biosynthesis protein B [Deltaproteobacteria bacterium]